MRPAPQRPDEPEALAALHRLEVLDSAAEAEFDALVQAASVLCGTPISLVSLVDAERQWFKANVGLPGAAQTPRDIAFCAHAVLGTALFEVPDTLADARFADNPLVTAAPHIRFYAGVPLRLTGGEQVGTLCVIDRQPRRLTSLQRQVLAQLGVAVTRALEGRRAVREMSRAALVEAHSPDAIIGTDQQGRVTRWNRAAERLFGHTAAAMLGRSLGCLMPSGQVRDAEDIGSNSVTPSALTFDSVRRHANGALIDVSITTVPEFGPNGRPIGLTKFVRDITDRVQAARRKEAEQAQAQRMYESTPAMLHSVDRQGRLIAVSDLWLAKLGYTRKEVIGRPAPDLLALESRQRAPQVLTALFADGRVADIEYQVMARDGRVLDMLLSAVVDTRPDGSAVSLSVMQDVTERRRAERELVRARHDLQKILDAMPSQIGYWDTQLHNQIANQAYQHWFGIDPARLKGLHMRDVLGDELFARSRSRLEAALAGQAQSFYEHQVPTADGRSPRHAQVSYLPDIVDGQVRGLYTLVHDITEGVEARRELAAAQRESEALLGTLNQHAIFSVADHRGRIIEVNDNFCAISGYEREELLGQNHRVLNSGRHGREFWVGMWRTIASGQAWRGEVCNRAKDGSLYWVNSIVAPFVGADGRIEKYISIRSDITAAKQAEQLLRSSEAFLDRAGQIAGVGGWELDLQSNALHWSAQTRRIHEVEPDYQPVLDEVLALYAHGDRDVMAHAVEAGIQRGMPWDLELRLTTAKGRAIWARSVGTAEFEHGQAVRLVGAFQDITERKQAELTLAYERQLMTSLLDTLPDQIYFKDRDSRFLRINPALAHRFGLDHPDQATGKSDADFFLPDHAAKTAAQEQRIVDTGEPILDLEEQQHWPDRPPTWNLTTKMPLLGAEGHVIGTFGISRDITARRQLEAELQRTNERFQLAAGSVGIGVWEYDLASGTLDWDDRMYELYGRRRVAGREPYALWSGSLHPDDRARSESELRAAVEGAQTFDTSFRVLLPDGSIRHLRAAAQVVRDAEGRPLRMTGVNFDVTERALVDDELASTVSLLLHTARKADAANQAKSQFLANMSHEIRTPMNAVIGLSYLLERTPLTAEQADTLGKIKLASKSLLSVINDVLDLSKIEAAEMHLERAPFALRNVLTELTALSQLQADAKGVGFTVHTADDLPEALVGDATRLRQVLTNLLSNAIKFTERGGVRLSVQVLRSQPRQDDQAGQVRLRFSVEDTGIGIAPEALPRLFTPFAQADTSTTRRFGGTGLGLSIIKQLVTLMNGAVGVNSVPQQGSEFWVELDFTVCGDSAFTALKELVEPIAGPGLHGVRVLVADDSPINLEVARRILELEGAQVWLARNGLEAVDYLMAMPDAVDVVLMDVQMPLLDGHDATRRIRSGLGLVKLPVIALTAGIATGEHERAAAAGMNDVVAKPFDPPALVRCIRRHVQVDARLSEPAGDCVMPALAPAPGQATGPATLADDALAWPYIEGIEAADARRRLGGDVALFGALLERLLDDFTDLSDGVPATPADRLAARLHNLKGSAGTLGAQALQRLAAQAEAACRAPQDGQPSTSVRRVAQALRALRHAAGPVLQALRAEAAAAAAAEAAPSAAPLDPQALDALRLQLRQFDLGAVAHFKALAPQLRGRLDGDTFASLRTQIDNLQFAEAVAALDGV
jgi:PAS domain S-box-containing protein